jgi:hypothetical protein
MELFFEASSMLTRFPALEVQACLRHFLRLRPELEAMLQYATLKPRFEAWIDTAKNGGSFGLGARLGMVALLLWRILIDEKKDAFHQLDTCLKSLNEESRKYYFKNKTRLFLAKTVKSPLAPFSCFYYPESLPFADMLSGGNFRKFEEVYSSNASRDCLFELSGKVRSAPGKKERFVVSCSALEQDNIFMFAEDCVLSLVDGLDVTFVLGIRDGGLVALGLRPASVAADGAHSP